MTKKGYSRIRRASQNKNKSVEYVNQPQKEKGKLILLLKDPTGQPIKSRTKITITGKAPSYADKYEATGKSGEVTRFVFDLAPQAYFVKVLADGFKAYIQSVSVKLNQDSFYEFVLSLKDPSEKGKQEREDEEENDAERLKGHMEYFLQRRTYPNRIKTDASPSDSRSSRRISSDTGFPSDAREKALAQKKRMKSMTSAEAAAPVQTPGCNWLSSGPRNINGRIRAMAIHPTDGNTVFAGSANGGVWVTRDAGQSWRPLMRDEGALEIGAVAVHLKDPSNPAGDTVIYAGTGEPTFWPGYKGIGVLKSIDSGANWNLTGTMPTPGNDRFSVILIDSATVTSDPLSTTVYAGGTPGGLYKSTDGGTSWQLLLDKNIEGLAMDPTDHSVLYAAVTSEGIYKYDPVTNSWNTFNTGFPSSFPQLILIAIGESTPHKMYAKLDETVYIYDSATSSWQSLGNHGGATYGYWNNVMAVDPQDSDIIYAGGLDLERSFDGGQNWQSIGELHVDQHALVINSINHLNVYAGNDGGVYRGTYTTPMDIGVWTKVSDGLIITQFNHVGVSSAGIDVIGGGTQDNGTNRTVGGLTWDNVLEADGGYYVVDPDHPYIQYAETQNGRIYKSIDGGTTWSLTSFPGGPWVTPILLDATSPLEPNRILFAGGNDQVYRTINSASTWAPSSPSIGGFGINSIAISSTSSAIVYAGTGAGKVWRSSDNGATMSNWTDITVGIVTGSVTLPNRSITDIVVHPTDPNIVYVTFGGFESMTSATPGHVFRGTSVDSGISWKWENISSNLPDIPVSAIQVNPASTNIFYIGSDVGIFATSDGGISWLDFEPGLPNVVITDLALNSTGDLLRAATYGRGMFEIQLKPTCPDVDVYIRDNKLDTGETIPSPSGVLDPTIPGSSVYWWESADIKIDSYPYYPVDSLFDGIEFDFFTNEDVIRNDASHPDPNRLYIQVHNRGPLPAHNVKVKVIWLDCAAATPLLPSDFWSNYPNDWTAPTDWKTVDASTPFQTIPELQPNTPKILMWNWTVPTTASDHVCMLGIVSSDKDPVSRSDAIPDDHKSWVIVPNDKHITQRNLHIITALAPRARPEPIKTILDFHNPFDFHQYFDIVIDKRLIPKESKLNILLPKVEMRRVQIPDIATTRGITLTKVSGKERLKDKVRGISKKGLEYDFSMKGGSTAHPEDKGIEIIPDIMITPLGKIQATLLISPPPKAEPGSTYRFVIMQRHKEIIMGGSTYEVRITPAEVKGSIIRRKRSRSRSRSRTRR
jgi:photosystem II stability/assembly factor-like uncharacterized protein